MKTRIVLLTFFAVSLTLFAQKKNDPILMTINGNPITKSEFEYIYNKNNSASTLDKKTLEEYVDLFVNFKLKVEEAKAQGIDTTAAFIKEYSGYRSQLTKPYLIDKEAEEAAVKEAYERMKEDVEVSHILIRIPNTGVAADTLEAWNKIKSIEKRLKKEDFAKVAKQVSEDPSAVENGGHIGWLTAFSAIYPFENIVYNTPKGSISAPVRTSIGYHIIKVHNRRNSIGEVSAAHIMTFTKEGEDEKNAQAKHRIDSLYQRVLAGDNFGELAQKYSDDKGSAANNGELSWFGIGRMVPPFEKAAFALENVGDVSQPVLSPYGWHIIKLLDKRGVPPFETAKAEIERKIKRDERGNVGQRSFVEKLKKEYNLQILNENVAEFSNLLEGKTMTDSVFLAQIAQYTKPLFTFADKKYSQADFANYIKSTPHSSKNIAAESINEKLNAFISNELTDYADSQLESKHDDLRFLTQEYHDGILLFEISNQEVWEKASKDTLGLTEFFNKNKDDYKWDKPHYKGRVIYAKDKKTLKAAQKIVKKSPTDSIDKHLRALNDSVQYVKIEKGLYVEGDNKVIDEKIFKTKEKYVPTEEFPLVFVAGKMLKLTPESYMDVRGLVTADYQNYLEQEWIKSLRQKYTVTIDENILKTVKKN